MNELIAERRQQVLYDQKWKKFAARSRLWRYLPFVEFVLAAGSMAIGNVRPESDFDVIVAVSQGRIFTGRFFSVFLFGLLGWRRKKLIHQESAVDKICLNHFITEKSFRLSPPHNEYWQLLYRHLVPLFGETKKIRRFWKANQDWLGAIPDYEDDLRHLKQPSSAVKTLAEKILGDRAGDWLENQLKKIQIKRIIRGLPNTETGSQPRIKYSDEELEFHPDTRRIDAYNQILKNKGKI